VCFAKLQKQHRRWKEERTKPEFSLRTGKGEKGKQRRKNSKWGKSGGEEDWRYLLGAYLPTYLAVFVTKYLPTNLSTCFISNHNIHEPGVVRNRCLLSSFHTGVQDFSFLSILPSRWTGDPYTRVMSQIWLKVIWQESRTFGEFGDLHDLSI